MNCAVPSGTRYLHTILKIAIHLLQIGKYFMASILSQACLDIGYQVQETKFGIETGMRWTLPIVKKVKTKACLQTD